MSDCVIKNTHKRLEMSFVATNFIWGHPLAIATNCSFATSTNCFLARSCLVCTLHITLHSVKQRYNLDLKHPYLKFTHQQLSNEVLLVYIEQLELQSLNDCIIDLTWLQCKLKLIRGVMYNITGVTEVNGRYSKNTRPHDTIRPRKLDITLFPDTRKWQCYRTNTLKATIPLSDWQPYMTNVAKKWRIHLKEDSFALTAHLLKLLLKW